MIKDFVVKDNIFSDPHEIVRLAKMQTYYSREKHPDSNMFYEGYRTENLMAILDEKNSDKIHIELFKKLFLNENYNCLYGFDFVFESFFHCLTENEIYNDSWIHKDDDSNNFLAGVIYLNDFSCKEYGTKIFNGKEILTVENAFNRGTLYNAQIPHSAQGGFGQSIENGRLTLTIFIKKVSLEMQCPNLKA